MADEKNDTDRLADIDDVQVAPLSEEDIESVAGGTGAGSCTCCCPSGPTFTCPPTDPYIEISDS
jgi:hypothetical protein